MVILFMRTGDSKVTFRGSMLVNVRLEFCASDKFFTTR